MLLCCVNFCLFVFSALPVVFWFDDTNGRGGPQVRCTHLYVTSYLGQEGSDVLAQQVTNHEQIDICSSSSVCRWMYTCVLGPPWLYTYRTIFYSCTLLKGYLHRQIMRGWTPVQRQVRGSQLRISRLNKTLLFFPKPLCICYLNYE